MDGKIPLFMYQVPKTAFTFVGTNAKQVIDTLDYYKTTRGQSDIIIPSESEVKQINGASILVAFPMACADHNIEAIVRENVTFVVNANAFDHIRDISRDYDGLKRGSLYKFEAGALGTSFLPREIMESLKSYDWSQHTSQVDQWLGKRHDLIREGVSMGLLDSRMLSD